MEKIKIWLSENWYYVLIPVLLIVGFFVMRKKKKVGRSVRRSLPRSVGVHRTEANVKKTTSKKGFSRRIGNVVYTDSSKWAARMKQLRKKS